MGSRNPKTYKNVAGTSQQSLAAQGNVSEKDSTGSTPRDTNLPKDGIRVLPPGNFGCSLADISDILHTWSRQEFHPPPNTCIPDVLFYGASRFCNPRKTITQLRADFSQFVFHNKENIEQFAGKRFLQKRKIDIKKFAEGIVTRSSRCDELLVSLMACYINEDIALLGTKEYVWSTHTDQTVEGCALVFVVLDEFELLNTIPKRPDIINKRAAKGNKGTGKAPSSPPAADEADVKQTGGNMNPSLPTGSPTGKVTKKNKATKRKRFWGPPRKLPKRQCVSSYSNRESDKDCMDSAEESGQASTEAKLKEIDTSDKNILPLPVGPRRSSRFKPVPPLPSPDDGNFSEAEQSSSASYSPDDSSSEAVRSDPDNTRGQKRKRKRRVPAKRIPTGRGSLSVTEHGLKKPKKKQRVHKCASCNAVYTTYADMKMCEAQHGVKYVCTKYSPCCKTFGSAVGLQQHEMAHRTAFEDLKKCQECGKKFLFDSGLKKHMKSHSNLKPYCCYIGKCEKAYKSKSDCARHVREHILILEKAADPAKDVEKFPCTYKDCSYVGASKKKLQDHMVKHVGVACNFCHKLFYHRNTLKRHRDAVHYAPHHSWFLWLPDTYTSYFFPCQDQDKAYPPSFSSYLF